MSEDNKNLLTEGTVRRFMTLANLKSITPLRTLREQPELPLEDEVPEEEALALDDAGEADLALDLGDDEAAMDLEADALGAEEGAEENEAAEALAQELMDEIKPVLASFLAQNADIAVEDTAAMTPPALDGEVELDVAIDPAAAEGVPEGPLGDGEDEVEVELATEGTINEDSENHYGDDAKSDEEHIRAIRHHLDALEDDKDYDEGEDEDEGFNEGKLVETVAARVAERILKLNGDDRS
jgi:hypothetical protein